MIAQAGISLEIKERIVSWLNEKGIRPDKTMKRHILGLIKALETIANSKH